MKTHVAALVSVLALSACNPQQPQAVPAPPPSTDAAAPASAPVTPDAASSAAAAPADTPPPAAAPPAAGSAPPPASTPVQAPPASTPTASAAPGSAPRLESMALARPSAKISVPADLRYQFDGPVVEGQPATLHLAAVPRVTSNGVSVEIPAATGFAVTRSPAAAQKADAGGVYRQQYSLTRRAGAPAELTVLVTMDLPEGKAFGFFAVPLDAGNTAQKSDSVKQR